MFPCLLKEKIQKNKNDKPAHDCLIVQFYFERETILLKVMVNKYSLRR